MQVNYHLNTESVVAEIKDILKENSIPARRDKYEKLKEEYNVEVMEALKKMGVSFDSDGRGSMNKDNFGGQREEEQAIATKFKKDKIREIESKYKKECEYEDEEQWLKEDIKVLNLRIEEYNTMLGETREEIEKWKIEIISLLKKEINSKYMNYTKKCVEDEFEITNKLGVEKIIELKNEIKLLIKEHEIEMKNLFEETVKGEISQKEVIPQENTRLRRRRKRLIKNQEEQVKEERSMVEIVEAFLKKAEVSIKKIIEKFEYKKTEEYRLAWDYKVSSNLKCGGALLEELNYVIEELHRCHERIMLNENRIEKNKAIKIWEQIE